MMMRPLAVLTSTNTSSVIRRMLPRFASTTATNTGKIATFRNVIRSRSPMLRYLSTNTQIQDDDDDESTFWNDATSNDDNIHRHRQQLDNKSKSSSNSYNTSKNKNRLYPKETPRTSVLMELTDNVGILHDVLRFYWKYDVNVTRIESRPAVKASFDVSNNGNSTTGAKFDFFVDFEGKVGDENVDQLLDSLESFWAVDKLLILDEKEVHWFPRHISELDRIANRTLDAGTDLEADHPGFHDPIYRSRRADLAKLAQDHRWNKPIDVVDYTEKEVETWTAVWDRMENLWSKYACKEYLGALNLMKENCNYNRTNIPQQRDISNFLQSHTNFQMRPVAGLLSSRDFLNGLAFRVFFSTQYIRHSSKPLYTPEPDLCHELLGHAPMFANRDFCDFSQEIGLASLGASEEDVQKLAHCYWHSVEFGLCQEEESASGTGTTRGALKRKAYGAGLLSSFGELEYACGDDHSDKEGWTKPEILEWDPEVAAVQEFPITTYQPVYFLAQSLTDGKKKMRKYCEQLPRPFFAQYNAQTKTVYIDRPVKRTKETPPNV